MYCERCGTENVDEAKFCRSCGAKLESYTEQPVWVNSMPVKKKKKKLWLIPVILIILAAVGGGGFFALKYVEEKRIEKNAEEYQNYVTQADKYFEKLEYKKAEDFYLKAIAIDPKQKKPYLKLSDVYVAQEEYEKAVDILEQAEKVIGKDDSEIQDKKEEITKRAEYIWVVKPTVEADDIYYVKEDDSPIYTRNGLEQQFQSPYAVIKKDDALGLIDMNGDLKLELEYEIIYKVGSIGNENYVVKKKNPEYSMELERDQYYYALKEDGNLEEIVNWGDIGVECGGFYWCNGIHNTVEEDEFLAEYNSIPKSAIPIKESAELYGRNNSSSWIEWCDNLNSLYAVCKDGKLVTDFVYDECGASSEGLLAVCKDDKWGYINESGKMIIPMKYDSSWKNYGKYSNAASPSADSWIAKEYCYAASHGYVNLCKDNKWELRDTKGNLVILPGVFEKILPVYNGKCWVKKNGKWGVIQIEGAQINREPEKPREEPKEEPRQETSVREEEWNRIAELEKQEEALNNQLSSAMDQNSMTQCAGQLYQLWDDEINVLWAKLKEHLSAKEMESLTAEQREWIQYKEEMMKQAGAEAEGGSMQPMLEYDEGAELTKSRVKELAERLPN